MIHLVVNTGSNITGSVTEISVTPSVPKRYGHMASVFKNKLIIVGGVCPELEPFTTPEICVIDLVAKSSVSITLTTICAPFMFANHCSLMTDDDNLIIAGGGANCFSFGTCFNDRIIQIPLKKIFT